MNDEETLTEIYKRINTLFTSKKVNDEQHARNILQKEADQWFKDGLIHSLPVWENNQTLNFTITIMLKPAIHNIEVDFGDIFS